MARADLLVDLVKAGSQGDRTAFVRLVESIAAEGRAKNHSLLADRLVQSLTANGNSRRPFKLVSKDEKVNERLHETMPQRSLDSLLLPATVQATCEELVAAHHRADLLRIYNLEPRHRVRLAGPPGNGKTTLAESLVNALMVPRFTVRDEAVSGSFPGEPSQRVCVGSSSTYRVGAVCSSATSSTPSARSVRIPMIRTRSSALSAPY